MATHIDPKSPVMGIFEATMIAEGNYDLAGYSEDCPPDEQTVVDAWQMLIDTGTAWSLQGWFGRMAERMIDEGYCAR